MTTENTAPMGPRFQGLDKAMADEWSDTPEQALFLGGCHSGDNNEEDLYLFTWAADTGYEPEVGGWDGEGLGHETCSTVDEHSSDYIREALTRAYDTGSLKRPAKPQAMPEDLAKSCAEEDSRAGIRTTWIYLGSCNTGGNNYRLLYRTGGSYAGTVYSTAARPATFGNKWNIDSRGPMDAGLGNSPGILSLEEGLSRAKERGLSASPPSKLFTTRLPDPEAPTQAIVKTPTTAAEVAAALRAGAPVTTAAPEAAAPERKTMTEIKTKQFKNVTVAEAADEQIHLPKGMSYAQGVEWLIKIEQAEEQEINWQRTFDAYPLDGAYALRQLLAERFGTAVQEGATVQTMFGEKDVPPYMIALEIGVDETTYVPWGHFIIPPMPGHKLQTSMTYENKQLMFVVVGKIKRKFKKLMDEIGDQLQARLRDQSIYRGKAFRVDFPTKAEAAERGFNPFDWMPRFINTATKIDKLILSDRVKEQIETNIFTPVQHADECRRLGVPLKRGVLLEGKYGVGKSLTAHVLSQKCVENGWTFIYVKRVSALEDAMRFAKRYEPAVVFAEDIDAAMQQKEGSDRDEAMNTILNTIDGVDMKKSEQMVVLTTNFVDRINKAFLRPGRLDAVISVDPPDAAAVLELLRHYSRGLLDEVPDAELQPAAQLLAGQIPSVVREVVERSKLASIRRAASKGDTKLEGDDLRVAAAGIMGHIALLKEAEPDRRSDIEKAAATLGTILTKGHSNGNGKSRDSVADLQKLASTT